MGAAGSPPIVGVNTGGWLLIEEWMFSFGIFDGVGESEDQPQGVIMPPVLENGLGEFWYCEVMANTQNVHTQIFLKSFGLCSV